MLNICYGDSSSFSVSFDTYSINGQVTSKKPRIMYEHRRSPTQFYYTAPYAVPVYGSVAYPVEIPIDVNWYQTWPKLKSIFLAIVILICSMAIIGLDIANIAIERNKQNGSSKLGSDTGKVGAGIWCGTMSFFAALFILIIGKQNRTQDCSHENLLISLSVHLVFVRNKRIAATFALAAVTLAFFFLIILIGLIGNAIQNNLYANDRTDVDNIQNKLLIAIISIATVPAIFCMIFFLLYIRVFFSSSTRPST